MFARVVHIQAKPGALDEVVALYWQAVAPVLRAEEGFHDTWLLTDLASGSGVSITLWQTEQARAANADSGRLQQQMRLAIPLLAAPPRSENLLAHLAQ